MQPLKLPAQMPTSRLKIIISPDLAKLKLISSERTERSNPLTKKIILFHIY